MGAAPIKSKEEEEEEMGIHRTTNLEEAKTHTHTLDDTLEKLDESIREGVAEDIMRKTIIWFRKAIITIAPTMEEANVDTVFELD